MIRKFQFAVIRAGAAPHKHLQRIVIISSIYSTKLPNSANTFKLVQTWNKLIKSVMSITDANTTMCSCENSHSLYRWKRVFQFKLIIRELSYVQKVETFFRTVEVNLNIVERERKKIKIKIGLKVKLPNWEEIISKRFATLIKRASFFRNFNLNAHLWRFQMLIFN